MYILRYKHICKAKNPWVAFEFSILCFFSTLFMFCFKHRNEYCPFRERNCKKKKKKIRSSHWRCSVRKGVLRNFVQFTRKHLFQSLIFDKVAGMRPATLLKMRLWYRYFPVNFAKFLRAPFLQNTSGRLLLKTARKKIKVVALFEV